MPRSSSRTRRRSPLSSKLDVERLEDRALPSMNAWHFDFGIPSAPTEPGYIAVPLAPYSAAQGYGWQSVSEVSAVDRGVSSPLTRDFHQAHQATFRADVANGAYQVTLHLGDVDGTRAGTSVSAEGFLFGDTPATGWREVISVSFLMQVADGQLNLQLTDTAPAGRFALAGLDMVALDSSAPAFDGDFSGGALGAGWITNSWDGSGGGALSLSTAGGVATFAGGQLRSNRTFANMSIEGQVAFAAAPWQHFGAATGLDRDVGNYWAIFSSAGSTDRLYARVNANGTAQDVDLGPLPAGLHAYRINPVPGAFEFYVDGALKTIVNVAIPGAVPLRMIASAFHGSSSMQLDWVRLRDAGLFRADHSGPTLGPEWETSSWSGMGGGSLNHSVINGLLTLSGGQVRALATFSNHAVEGRVRFGSGSGQDFGMATNLDAISGNCWATFSTGPDNRLVARVNVNGDAQDVDLGPVPDGFHNYRISPALTGFEFSIDGALRTTISKAMPPSVALRVTSSVFSDSPSMQVDWVSVESGYVPLTADAGADQSSAERDTVHFSGAVTGGTGPYAYSWSFGDGATGPATPSASHAYADNGQYTATLVARDIRGVTVTATALVTVSNVTPTANAGGAYFSNAGSAINFSGWATDPSSVDAAAGFTYLWNFGDGATSSLQRPSHAYAAPGAYVVTLNVTDKDGGVASATTTASVAENAGPAPLVYRENLQYVGAFRVPPGTFGVSTFEHGGTALAFNPQRNSLFMVGHDWDQAVAEISIPQSIAPSNQLNDLTTASVLQPFVTPLRSAPNDSLAGRRLKVGGLIVHDGELIGAAYDYYDGNGTAVDSHFKLDSLELSTANVSGFFQVGDAGGGLVGGYMAAVPPEWQSALGSPFLTGQSALPVIGRTSSGPAAFGFDPHNLGPGVTPITPYVYYPLLHQLAPMTGPANLLFNGTTAIDGVVFARGTRSILFFGSHGVSETGYGEAATFNDPYRAGKGYHAVNGQYQYQVWAYRADDFLAVKNGQVQPWAIKPYAVWSFEFPVLEGAKRIGGVAYDAASGRLYVSQMRGDAASARPLIHVFQLSFNRPGDAFLKAPTIGSVTGASYLGGNITLTASDVHPANVARPIIEVVFFLDLNRDGCLEPGADPLLGYATHTGDTWTLTFSTSGLAPGSYTIFARAKDEAGIFSDLFSISVAVDL